MVDAEAVKEALGRSMGRNPIFEEAPHAKVLRGSIPIPGLAQCIPPDCS